MTTTSTWPLVRVVRDRDAGLFLAGAVVSRFGSSAMWLACGVWVKGLTGSDGLAALCLLALWLPTLAGPALGTLADRGRRRPLLIALNLASALLLLALLAVGSADRLWLLFAVLVGYGALGVVHDAAESALVAAAVAPRLLGDFNGLRMTVTEGMKLVAPLTGAGLYAAYGGRAVALLDAATFVLAAGLCAAVRVREAPPEPPAGHWWERTAEGARHLWRHPGLRPLVLAGGVTMLCAGIGGATLYPVVDSLGRPPAYAGVLYAVQGAGSVAGGLLAGPALRHLGDRWFAAAGIGLFGAAVAVRAVPVEPVVLASSAAVGIGLPAVLIAALTAVQRETPAVLRGRAAAASDTLVFGPNVLGLAVGAALVGVAGLWLLLPALGAVLLTTALVLAQRPARPARTAAKSMS
ncbi:MFS transporter [Streptomyces sp. NPDC048182]|uniref:MFS transporter n=1 Tax=Streptomyces sp. NPDC048182 TaxID=3365507 RepID=UPI00371D046B